MLRLPKRNSLVSEAAETIREGIAGGVWEKALPGERVLARDLQVSRPTVRSALAILEKEGLVKSTRGIGRRIARSRRRLTAESRDCVAVLSAVPAHLMPPASLFYLNELRNGLQQAGLRLDVISDPGLSGSNPDPVLGRLTSDPRIQCWILAAPSEAVQHWFAERPFPILSSGSCAPGVKLPYLDLDYRAVCRHAAGVFLRNGHRRLCLFLAASPAAADHLSEDGFQEGIQRFGEGSADGRIVRHDGTREDICQKLDSLLDEEEGPTALLGSRPMHVLTAFTHLTRRGRLHPNGVSFISRDSDTFLGQVSPEITRYTFRRRSFARRLTRLTLQLADNQSLPVRPFLLMPEYLPGETVGRP